MTKVKICGITNLADALFAEQEGADALGFNFFSRSPRFIEADSAAEITCHLAGTVEKFGVFVNESMNSILSTIRIAKLDAVQLHGDESPGFVSELREHTNVKIVKAIRVRPGFELSDVKAFDADDLLLDAYVPGEFGGTGRSIDPELAALVKATVPRLYLAGGLGVENVGDAIRRVRPYAVDACSRLEIEPGRKDREKVRLFIANARAAL